jgi:hypothetical protein
MAKLWSVVTYLTVFNMNCYVRVSRRNSFTVLCSCHFRLIRHTRMHLLIAFMESYSPWCKSRRFILTFTLRIIAEILPCRSTDLMLDMVQYVSLYLKYRMAQMSSKWLVTFLLRYVRNFFTAYCIYKNCSKWDPPFSVHNSQCCDTALQIDWHNSVLASKFWKTF